MAGIYVVLCALPLALGAAVVCALVRHRKMPQYVYCADALGIAALTLCLVCAAAGSVFFSCGGIPAAVITFVFLSGCCPMAYRFCTWRMEYRDRRITVRRSVWRTESYGMEEVFALRCDRRSRTLLFTREGTIRFGNRARGSEDFLRKLRTDYNRIMQPQKLKEIPAYVFHGESRYVEDLGAVVVLGVLMIGLCAAMFVFSLVNGFESHDLWIVGIMLAVQVIFWPGLYLLMRYAATHGKSHPKLLRHMFKPPYK